GVLRLSSFQCAELYQAHRSHTGAGLERVLHVLVNQFSACFAQIESSSVVMPALVAGIHVLDSSRRRKPWMASDLGLARGLHLKWRKSGEPRLAVTSPAMTW